MLYVESAASYLISRHENELSVLWCFVPVLFIPFGFLPCNLSYTFKIIIIDLQLLHRCKIKGISPL